MALASNLVGADRSHRHPARRAALNARYLAPSHHLGDFAWRLMHACGEMLAFLWGIGVLTAVGLFVAGIFG